MSADIWRDLGRIGWVFDGGGFLSAYGVGMAEGCWNASIRPHYIQAVSGGVFAGAKIAENRGMFNLLKIWHDIDKSRSSRVFNRTRALLRLRSNSLFDDRGIRKLIQYINPELIRESPIDFDVVVTNETRNHQREFVSNRDLQPGCSADFVEMLYASTALMGFLPPVRMHECVYSDGMYYDIRRAFQQKCQTVFVFVNRQNYTDLIDDPYELGWQDRLKYSLKISARKNEMQSLAYLLRHHRNVALFHHPDLTEKVALMRRRLPLSQEKKPRRLIVYLSPTITIPSLEIIHFRQGDIAHAISHGCSLSRRVCRLLLSSLSP